METYREKARTLFILITLGCIAGSALLAVDRYADIRMQQLDQSSAEITDRLMDLNAEVLEDIPPPEGAVLVRFENGPCNVNWYNCYTVSLYAEYAVKNLSDEEIYKYYDEFLTAKNWKSVRGFPFYYRGTSCIEIDGTLDGVYPIHIWHDFFNQSFSPNLPPSWILQYESFGEFRYQPCPPS